MKKKNVGITYIYIENNMQVQRENIALFCMHRIYVQYRKINRISVTLKSHG